MTGGKLPVFSGGILKRSGNCLGRREINSSRYCMENDYYRPSDPPDFFRFAAIYHALEWMTFKCPMDQISTVKRQVRERIRLGLEWGLLSPEESSRLEDYIAHPMHLSK